MVTRPARRLARSRPPESPRRKGRVPSPAFVGSGLVQYDLIAFDLRMDLCGHILDPAESSSSASLITAPRKTHGLSDAGIMKEETLGFEAQKDPDRSRPAVGSNWIAAAIEVREYPAAGSGGSAGRRSRG